jgi:chemotaxis protein MotB
MSAGHKRRHKHEEHEEHANHERWLVAYADMLTVLMALFIVLFALSQVDQLKFAQFKEGLTEGTSSTNLALSGQQGVNDVTNGQDPIDLTPVASGGQAYQPQQAERVLQAAETAQAQADLQEAKEEVEDYREIAKQINDALTAKDDQDQVTYRITSDGLVVGLVADNVFFANASAEVEEKGREVLDTIAPILAQLPNDVAVQGHTNSLPLSSTTRYRDNWDLSAARAMTVVQRFVAAGIPGNHLSGTGYADSRPLYPNEDPKALTGNRRVDLVIASPSSDAVKALLPEVAAQTATGDGPELLTDTADTAGTTASTTSTSTTVSADVDAAAGITPDIATNVAH